ncbi:MAG TPA: hypothetical protein VGH28_21420 [Polyangiaceae bacterium]
MLVHFVTQGLIDVAATNARTSIKPVQPGWHSCQFYLDDNQLLGMVAPYMAEGLANGEG